MSKPGPSHLPGCIPASGGDWRCAEVRALYGACPDHDAFCEPGCPLGPVVPGGQYAAREDELDGPSINVQLGPISRGLL
jgi:hypothetical protein